MAAAWRAVRTVQALSTLAAALVLALLAWFFLPALWPTLAGPVQLALPLLPLLAWLAWFVVALRRAARRDAALVAGVTQPDASDARRREQGEALAHERGEASVQLAVALERLRQLGGGRAGHLYQQPWYMLIGPPASGKSTAIRHAGLELLSGEEPLAGTGGTRHCAFWVTDRAVLVDTAGRFTTQDSDPGTDRAGWDAFLDLLARTRPDQPLNGIIVAFGVDQLARAGRDGCEQQARTVRRRLEEIQARFGQRLPVYFVVSKADLIAGFSEFFDDLDAQGRSQVWGMTFPADGAGPAAGAPAATSATSLVEAFRSGFQGLLDRLHAGLPDRLQAERGLSQRAAIAGFPAQFASLQAPLAEFIATAFGGGMPGTAPRLRGVYFSSGVQAGAPIDRLAGTLARTFGMQAGTLAALRPQQGRSFFLARLLRDVVFNEAQLAARDGGKLRRQRRLRWGAWAGAAVLALLGIGWGWRAAAMEGERAARVDAAARADQQAAQAVQAGGIDLPRARAGDDLARALPLLDAAAALPAAASGPAGGLALDQGPKLQAAGEGGYAQALTRVLLPRLLARLEAAMREQMQQPARLYVTTRAYLMLGGQGPMDPGLVADAVQGDWAVRWPGAVHAPTRESLAQHLAALLALPQRPAYPLDGELVDETRRVFSRLPADERVYARLRASIKDIPPWQPARVLGDAGQRLFVTTAGEPLARAGVSGLFTVAGLHRGLLPRLPKAIADAAREGWVLGADAPVTATDPVQLEGAVLRRYAQDYVGAWQQMLDSLALVPMGSATQQVQALNLLGAPKSPLRDLLQGVARELSPDVPPAGAAAAAATAASAAMSGRPGAALAAKLAQDATGASATMLSPASIVAEVVDARFARLKEAAGAPMDGVLAAINEAYGQAVKTAQARQAGLAPPAGPDAGQRLEQEAQRAPEPLRRWLAGLAGTAGRSRAQGAKAAVAAAGAQQIAPLCRAVQARYPFTTSTAAADMPLNDFVALFGPGGTLEQFFNQNLREHVATGPGRWRPVAVAGGAAAVDADDVAQFERAAAIRRAFFPAGAGAAGLRFELVPVAGGNGVLEVDGTRTSFQPGGHALVLPWPARGPIELAVDGEPALWRVDGPWAALRLVARGRLQPTSVPDRLRWFVQQGGRTLEFELRTGSVAHPFGLPELAAFRCPRLSPT